VAAANPRTVVVVNAGSPVAMDWADRVPAVLDVWYPGQEAGNALADVLFGDVNPSGRLPTTFPKRIEDNPAYLNYPGENGEVLYGEGIFVGYRYYDRKRIEPRFAFGHGLSYTRFRYGELRLDRKRMAMDGELVASVEITNAGERAGSEVVQLYLRDLECSLSRPDQELEAFAKVSLAPGETKTVRFTLTRSALSFYDPARGGWVAEPGEFEIRTGSSSRDIRARARFALDGG
jgi:beta-glucosidase